MPPETETSPNPFAAYREADIATCLDSLDNILSQPRQAFLIGAGCSKCVGLPLTTELTTLIDGLLIVPETKALLADVSGVYSNTPATIEDCLSDIIDLLAIAERRVAQGATAASFAESKITLNAEMLRAACEEIKEAIIKSLDGQDLNLDTHRKFIRGTQAALRRDKRSASTTDFFVLNYDTLIEDSLALEKVPYVDGFAGGPTAWWEPASFEQIGITARVAKLHGSIDWKVTDNDPLPKRIRPSLAVTGAKSLIWPATTKYSEMQHDPYSHVFRLFRDSLTPTLGDEVVLTICGYSFGDAHINSEITNALKASKGRLTINIFTSLTITKEPVASWLSSELYGSQVRVYNPAGFHHGTKPIVAASSELDWWKFEVLADLVSGVR